MKDALGEAVRVAEAKDIRLPCEDPLSKVIAVCEEATRENVSSMLQDVLKWKLTEVEMINGVIVREGDRLGIHTPVNRTLTYLVQAIQDTQREKVH